MASAHWSLPRLTWWHQTTSTLPCVFRFFKLMLLAQTCRVKQVWEKISPCPSPSTPPKSLPGDNPCCWESLFWLGIKFLLRALVTLFAVRFFQVLFYKGFTLAADRKQWYDFPPWAQWPNTASCQGSSIPLHAHGHLPATESYTLFSPVHLYSWHQHYVLSLWMLSEMSAEVLIYASEFLNERGENWQQYLGVLPVNEHHMLWLYPN